MKIVKTGISLEEREMIELQSIVLDQDEKAALEFVKLLVKKIEAQQRHQCGTPLVKGE